LAVTSPSYSLRSSRLKGHEEAASVSEAGKKDSKAAAVKRRRKAVDYAKLNGSRQQSEELE
jgi:hypothetical protein